MRWLDGITDSMDMCLGGLWGFSEEVSPPPPTGAQSQEGMSGGTTRLVQRLLYPGAPWGLPGEGRGPTSQEDSRRCRWLSCL